MSRRGRRAPVRAWASPDHIQPVEPHLRQSCAADPEGKAARSAAAAGHALLGAVTAARTLPGTGDVRPNDQRERITATLPNGPTPIGSADSSSNTHSRGHPVARTSGGPRSQGRHALYVKIGAATHAVRPFLLWRRKRNEVP